MSNEENKLVKSDSLQELRNNSAPTLRRSKSDASEFERQKKLVQEEQNIDLKRSQDDLDILKEQGKTSFEEVKVEEPSKISFFGKIKDIFYKVKNSKIGTKIANAVNKFKNSKIGKVLFSNVLSYALSIGCAAIAVSGLFTPVSPFIITAAALSATGVGIRAVRETIKIRSLRKLQKENNLLVQHRNAKSIQDQILNLQPKLKSILANLEKDKISPPPKRDLTTNKHNIESKTVKTITEVLAKNILEGGGYIAHNIVEGLSGNVIAILKSTYYGATTTVFTAMDTLTEIERNDLTTIFKTVINEENKKSDIPDYANLQALHEITKKQMIQTTSLERLITHHDYWHMSDIEKEDNFVRIKGDIEKEIQEGKLYLEKKYKTSITKDIRTSLFDSNKIGQYLKPSALSKVIQDFNNNVTIPIKSVPTPRHALEDKKNYKRDNSRLY